MKPLSIVLLWASLLPACGYRPAYGGSRPDQRLTVEAASFSTPHVQAVHGALSGLRAELSTAGVLGPGRGYPRVMVEILRVDELPSGIAASPLPDGRQIPLGRGASVGVTGRAWVIEGEGAEPVRDTGDLRRVEHVAALPDVRVDASVHDDAVRAAARRLGRALARRILGLPEPDIEPM